MAKKPSQSEIEELLKLLEDPDIGEPVKAAIRESLTSLATGGFTKAYESNLKYLARSDLDAYSEYVFDKKPYAHHKEITSILMDETRTRELIICPPGAAKSTYVSTQFPTWYMGKYPNRNVMLISATADHAEKATVSVREVIDYHPRYHEVFPGIKKNEIRGWTKSSLFLSNNTDLDNPNPNFFASGAGGPVQGRRAHIIISDDQLDPEDVASKKKLAQQKLWTKEVLEPRFHPGFPGRMIVILTRWGDDDLASMLVNDMNFRVTLIPALGDDDKGAYVDNILPGHHYISMSDDALVALRDQYIRDGFDAEVVMNESFGRYCVRKYLHKDRNRSIWPSHMPVEKLLQVKKTNGTVRFNLVFNGNPAGLTGDVFKRDWFKYYGPGEEKEFIPPDAQFFQAVDVAVTKKDSSDYSIILTAALDREGNVYIVDVFRDRLEAPDQPKYVVAKYREYPKTTWVLIESVAYQMSLFQNVVREGIPCKSYKPQKDKEARARSASARFESGNVYINKLAPWKREFEDELTSFPRGEYDDQVDAVSSLLEELALRSQTPITLQIGFGSSYS